MVPSSNIPALDTENPHPPGLPVYQPFPDNTPLSPASLHKPITAAQNQHPLAQPTVTPHQRAPSPAFATSFGPLFAPLFALTPCEPSPAHRYSQTHRPPCLRRVRARPSPTFRGLTVTVFSGPCITRPGRHLNEPVGRPGLLAPSLRRVAWRARPLAGLTSCRGQAASAPNRQDALRPKARALW